MNQFLIDGILCRAVYCDNPHGFGEEIGGCWSFATKEVTECQYCPYQKACPADGEDERRGKITAIMDNVKYFTANESPKAGKMLLKTMGKVLT